MRTFLKVAQAFRERGVSRRSTPLHRRNLISGTAFKLATIGALAALSGCEQRIIEQARFKLSENFDRFRVELVFKESIRSAMSGSLQLKNYGQLFLTPYGENQPFTVGFDLNTAILNDQEYLQLSPTSYLPNGAPIGIEYPLIEIRPKQPINPVFDLSGYIDARERAWFGTASTFRFISDSNFPPGLAITGVFAQDSQGRPAIFANVFGAAVNPDGTLRRPGGIAVFANIKRLKQISLAQGGGTIALKPEKLLKVSGEQAERYSENPEALEKLQRKFIEEMNRH